MIEDFDQFMNGYAGSMLWANAYTQAPDGEIVDWNDHNLYGVYMDVRDPDYEDLYPILWDEASAFFAANYALMVKVNDEHGSDFGQHGHDFALTRNGHGAGFWDRGYGQDGDLLSGSARAYGELDLYYGELVDGTTGWIAE